MQKVSVLVSSSAVLNAPQNSTPPRNPPRVRKPRLSVVAGRLTMRHAHSSSCRIRRMASFAPGRPGAELAHVDEGVLDQRRHRGLRDVAGGAEVAARRHVGQPLPLAVHVVGDADPRRAGALRNQSGKAWWRGKGWTYV